MDFAVPADHRVKLNESKKKDKYSDLARKLKKTVTVVSIIIGALGTVTKELIQKLENLEITGCVETVQTITLLRSAWILNIVLMQKKKKKTLKN